jgi:hypothetical protein
VKDTGLATELLLSIGEIMKTATSSWVHAPQAAGKYKTKCTRLLISGFLCSHPMNLHMVVVDGRCKKVAGVRGEIQL